MDFIQINFIKNYMFCLVKNEDKYMVLVGKVLKPKIEHETVHLEAWLTDKISDCMPASYSAHIDLTFITKDDNTLFHLIGLHDKKEYDTVLSVAEVTL